MQDRNDINEPAIDPAPEPSASKGTPSAEVHPLQRLRKLVVGPTDSDVDKLRTEVEASRLDAEKVSEVLPDAIRRSSTKNQQLAKSLGPTLSDAFEQSIQRNPQGLADSIAPIMGPAIRRSITQQIQAMVQSLNKTLEHSLSPKSFRWRFEAWQTGKPFAEVVLLHTLVYRVEQLLLIDPETGLLMTNVSSVEGDDAGLVSSLLTAIQDFLRDSFQHDSASGSNLRTMHTNELTVWMQHGSKAILAVAIRGEPPIRIREDLQVTLERIHVEHGELLNQFDGDTDVFEPLRPELEDLLGSEFINQAKEPKEKKKPSKTKKLWLDRAKWIVPILVLGSLVAAFVANRREQRRQLQIANARSVFEEAPGFVLLSFVENGDQFLVTGLRDNLAAEPSTLLAETDLNPDSFTFHWEPYVCLHPKIVIQRLQKQLSAMDWLPDTVSLDLITTSAGLQKLIVSGKAPRRWEQRLRYTAALLSGVDEVDVSACTFTESNSEIGSLEQESIR